MGPEPGLCLPQLLIQTACSGGLVAGGQVLVPPAAPSCWRSWLAVQQWGQGPGLLGGLAGVLANAAGQGQHWPPCSNSTESSWDQATRHKHQLAAQQCICTQQTSDDMTTTALAHYLLCEELVQRVVLCRRGRGGWRWRRRWPRQGHRGRTLRLLLAVEEGRGQQLRRLAMCHSCRRHRRMLRLLLQVRLLDQVGQVLRREQGSKSNIACTAPTTPSSNEVAWCTIER